ncbi:MAG: winged helix-turn-helix domain-containing protein [Dehalococcoidia bacterium]|nr:winged helix-turn-helix domain-containing protein [Dehalococcoidia bacterium]
MTTPDYGSVLADLRKKRDEIDALIQGLERFVSPAKVDDRIEVGAAVSSDTFFNMTVPDAINKFLKMSQRPQSATQIADALEQGGLIHESKNFINTVYTALSREQKKLNVIQLPDKSWGLAERYPNRVRQKTGRTPAAGVTAALTGETDPADPQFASEQADEESANDTDNRADARYGSGDGEPAEALSRGT